MANTTSTKHPKISAYMNNVLDQYKHLRGHSKDVTGKPFWDMLVVTASDIAQKTAYEQQIEDKASRGELPIDLPIHVVSDPPGVRIGNGGSTLTCMEFLYEKYGDKLFEYKVLLVHAGGWSQRMPSASALGKVFSIVPHGNPPFQMLDLKLALYWPFVDRMQPGVFIVCADDFVVFDLGEDENWVIPGKGFTALAHPAPLEVGKSHGVFVLADPESVDTSQPVEICECLKVLQKPSESRMKTEGAPLKGDSFSFGDGIKLEGEVVYTDSCFYFGTDIMRRLIDLKKSIGSLSCEIDAYGDFLQAVGKNATNDYISLTFNVSQPTPNLLEMREKVFNSLNGSDIHVLVLNSSKFIHIGTTKELLHHFCHDREFQEQLCMRKNVFNGVENGDNYCKSTNGSEKGQDQEKNDLQHQISENSCIVHCCFQAESSIGSNCFLEFCQFEVSIKLANNCIISNCQVSAQESNMENICIPSHTFLHTVPITQGGKNGTSEYVTIFFHIEDNFKKSSSLGEFGSLPFLGSTVDSFLGHQGIEARDVLPEAMAGSLKENSSNRAGGAENGNESTKSSDKVSDKMSLWNLKLYTAHTSMTSSFEEALEMVNNNGCPRNKKSKQTRRLFSMAELLQVKNVSAMLKFRRGLYDRIMKRAN